MRAPFRWTFPIVALLATAAALLFGTDEPLALGAATVAVTAAALALWDSVRAHEPEEAGAPVEADVSTMASGEMWFEGGPMGQESIVLLLDRIDRALVHPSLPTRDARELARLRGLPREEFLRYLDLRMSELERSE